MFVGSETLRLTLPPGQEALGGSRGLEWRTGTWLFSPHIAQLICLSLLLPSQGKKKAAALFDSQAPICPICQVLLRPSELQEHMEQELEQLAQLPAR